VGGKSINVAKFLEPVKEAVGGRENCHRTTHSRVRWERLR